ncbi:NADH:ubiquinone oxidoreductase [Cuniculiplasma sp. SKW3]|uniref:NADH-quinone oxidoreductase subunit B family protein n=1 Tax=unclassified Cuniculiplasma TaxID=2619706 RepID=UPI003FD4C6DA
MKIWPYESIKNGIVTTKFPGGKNETISPWSTLPRRFNDVKVDCPTKAISENRVDLGKCISCGLCSEAMQPSMETTNYHVIRTETKLKRSFKIFPLDSGTCGACNTELMSIANPNYDVSRLGIFFTNTPKQADALAIMGVYNPEMEPVLRNAIESMSKPAVVVLFGACALSGGIIGQGLSGKIDADVIIGGCPPDPFVIIEALEKVRGR